LYNCPKDDPDHIHICYADDCDFTEGDLVRYELRLITSSEFEHNGRVHAMARFARDPVMTAEQLQHQSYQVAMMNQFEEGLRYDGHRIDEVVRRELGSTGLPDPEQDGGPG
jgi:hypothetical protein